MPALWHAPETLVEDRKRLVRCLVREVILDRGEGARGMGGITTIRIVWKSGAWTELRVRRPASSDRARTPEEVLDRIRALAPRMTDGRIAEVLHAEGFTTRMGLAWTETRVYRIRQYNGIPTGCPNMPKDGGVRGDGLVSVRAAADILGVVPSALAHWQRWGFLQWEQRGPWAPFWVRLTAQDIARLDGTLAAQGYGQWPIQEALRVLGMTKEQLRERARQGDVVGYRARVGDHWEWRVSLAPNAHSCARDQLKAE